MDELVGNDKFTALINAAVDGIFIIDCGGIIQIANQAVEKMLGYEQSDLIGQNIKFLMPPPYQEHHDDYLKEHLRTGKKKIIGIGREVEAKRKDGKIVQIHLTVGKYEDEEAIKFVGIIRDLSELKKSETDLQLAEHEIHDLVNRLAHVSRIGVMGEMAASMAHEINQPLTAISAYAQAGTRLLASDPGQTDDIVSALNKINDQALRAGGIIRGLRNWIKEQDVDRKSSNCNALIVEVIDIAKIEAKNCNIELKLNLDPDLPMIMCDSVQIQQVALNLIKNAIDAINGYSMPKVDASRTVLIKTERKGIDRVQISVSDFGPGIADGVADSLFEPFFTTKKTGMGMGLSICRTIIRAHGGELDFKSNPEGGVNFYFVLPTSVEST